MKRSEFVDKLLGALQIYRRELQLAHNRTNWAVAVGSATAAGLKVDSNSQASEDRILSAIQQLTAIQIDKAEDVLSVQRILEKAWEYYEEQERQGRLKRDWQATSD